MFDAEALRQQFPAMQQLRDGRSPVFLDGPGGTQVPRRVIEAIRRCVDQRNLEFPLGVLALQRPREDADLRKQL